MKNTQPMKIENALTDEQKAAKGQKIKDRREFEKKIVCEMIDLYEKGNPGQINTKELKDYAIVRINKCPFMETKSFCSACKVHCYQAQKREEIRQVMRYSGPRMLFHHPLMTLHHLWIEHHERFKRVFFLLLGLIGLGLGFLGAILPLLPAFPFLLLAAYGFGRSSKRLNDWFLQTNLYKDNIKDWREQRGMTQATKRRVLITISLVMLFGFLMMSKVPWARWILVFVWIGHVLYFRYGIKTLPTAETKKSPAF